MISLQEFQSFLEGFDIFRARKFEKTVKSGRVHPWSQIMQPENSWKRLMSASGAESSCSMREVPGWLLGLEPSKLKREIMVAMNCD